MSPRKMFDKYYIHGNHHHRKWCIVVIRGGSTGVATSSPPLQTRHKSKNLQRRIIIVPIPSEQLEFHCQDSGEDESEGANWQLLGGKLQEQTEGVPRANQSNELLV
ncbi:unnamed protein product [Citrullus colocynthis]|uniref:Uncharacterized protein n=1 Tax=Citrullus colocynthis TaxID=252529 RepID=A0ABP0Z3B7_9ROSI